MIVWHACTTSVCVFSLSSGGLHTTRWHFQFWLSFPHWLCDLCTRYRGVWGNISSPMPVSFFQCLLLWSTFNMHTKIWTWPGNASVWSLSWWRCSCRSICLSLVTAAVVWAVLDSTSGLDPSSDTIAPRYLKLPMVSSWSVYDSQINSDISRFLQKQNCCKYLSTADAPIFLDKGLIMLDPRHLFYLQDHNYRTEQPVTFWTEHKDKIHVRTNQNSLRINLKPIMIERYCI